MSESQDSRSTLFCCRIIMPQAPFHKYGSYPRSYTCVLDFLHLATSIPDHVPTSQITKPFADHDFVVGVSKGHRDPASGPNQWGAQRFYVPDDTVEGGVVEVATTEDKARLRPLLKDPAPGAFVYLEDVGLSLLCPVHTDAVWFLQFWVRNARSQQELEDITNHVRARRSGDPDFVEDEFTVRFNELRGVPNVRLQPARAPPAANTVFDDGTGARSWHVEDIATERPRLAATLPPPGLGFPQGHGPSPSLSQLHMLSGVNEASPVQRHGRHGSNGIDPAAAPFINRAPYQPGPNGTPRPQAATNQAPAVRQATSGVGAVGQPRPAEDTAASSHAAPGSSFPRRDQPLGLPPPLNNSASIQFGSITPVSVPRPQQYLQPSMTSSHPTSQQNTLTPTTTAFFQSARSPRIPPDPSSSTGFENRATPTSGSLAPTPDTAMEDPFVDAPSQRMVPTGMSAQAASAYAPFSGITGGLRPVKKKTWDVQKGEWVGYWVWSL